MLSADERTPVAMSLSEGQLHDGPQGRALLEQCGPVSELLKKHGKNESTEITLIADKAYESDKTRYFAKNLGYKLCIPPKSNRKEPWEYDVELYKRRNEVERIFRRVKEYRRVFTRYDKLDLMYMGFVMLGFIVEALR